MLNRVRMISGAVLVAVLVAASASAAAKKTAGAVVPGEDDFRSATGYTTVLMEHCKAVNRLARGKGAFKADLAREHAAEITRSADSASRHVKGYLAALGSDQRVLVTAQSGAQQAGESAMVRLAAQLDETLKADSPDRKVVADAVTDLYLVAKDLLVSHKAAGKALGIAAATPPRKATPRKPTVRKPKAAPDSARASAKASK